ncbi:C40 family peptidase [Streptomyces sp. NPDC005438]|uniref:C40 family peptidase n=1 Tax=Streptomyces sp. NPDC005438 TaxID=3156880 RepID=UPI00339E1513
MSQNAHKPRHRKPRSSKHVALRAGVAGGVLSTIAVTAAAHPASADSGKSPAETVEMPTLGTGVGSSSQEAAESLKTSALGYEQQAVQDKAAEAAQEKAEKRAEAERRAEAKRKAEARERASRAAERTSLTQADAPSTTTTTTSAPSSASGNVGTLISFLRGQLGKAYVMGATGPSAYDCSGLTQAAFRQIGVSLPRVSQAQSTTGTQVPVSQVKPGDLLFWGGVGSAHHVAVYVGDGKYIDAANPGKGVVEQQMSNYMPTSATRVL